MNRVFAILIIALSWSTCASAQSEADRLPREELAAYKRCNFAQARSIANQQGDPVSLGLAANEMCPAEENALIKALVRIFSARRAYNHLMFAKKLNAKGNAAAIVEARRAIEQKRSPLPPPQNALPTSPDEALSHTQEAARSEGAKEKGDPQVRLQDEWQECLFTTGTRFAKSNEPLADVLDASFAVCQPYEDALYGFFSGNTSGFRKFGTEDLFPEIKKECERRTKAVVLKERTQ